MKTSRMTRSVFGAVAALTASAALAAPAHAGVVVPNADCATPTLSKPFAQWGDTNDYKLVDGGSFEDGATGWQLKNGARIVAGNEPSKVHGASDASSLLLPAGSSAVSAPVCVGLLEPTMRFFAARNSGTLSTLTVAVQIQLAATGSWLTVPVGVDLGGGWAPTAPFLLLGNLLPGLNEQTAIRFVFTPILGGEWQIDDVYVDPRNKF